MIVVTLSPMSFLNTIKLNEKKKRKKRGRKKILHVFFTSGLILRYLLRKALWSKNFGRYWTYFNPSRSYSHRGSRNLTTKKPVSVLATPHFPI